MRLIAVLGILMTLTGCMSAGTVSDCPYKSLTGQNAASADLESIRASGKEVRLLYPDSYLGFERKPNRVNIIRDDNNEIVGVNCG